MRERSGVFLYGLIQDANTALFIIMSWVVVVYFFAWVVCFCDVFCVPVRYLFGCWGGSCSCYAIQCLGFSILPPPLLLISFKTSSCFPPVPCSPSVAILSLSQKNIQLLLPLGLGCDCLQNSSGEQDCSCKTLFYDWSSWLTSTSIAIMCNICTLVLSGYRRSAARTRYQKRKDWKIIPVTHLLVLEMRS